MVLFWLLFVLFLLCALYIFLAAPNLRRRKMKLLPPPRVYYAHRGLHDGNVHVAENSLPAFRAAAELGYGIELDVRETRDHVLVIHHDETLERSCGDKRPVRDVPWAELCEMRLFGTDEHIPTLDEVLALVHGRVPLIIEIKSDRGASVPCEAIRDRLLRYPGNYCVESFDPFVLRWFRHFAPRIIRGQLSCAFSIPGLSFKEHLQRVALTNLLTNCIARPDFIAYGYQTDANISFRLIASVFRPMLAVWTVQDVEKARELKSRYDILIFERFYPTDEGFDQEEEPSYVQ